MVSKSFAAFKSFSELSQLILKHLASCKSLSLFNSQKLRVLLSSRCLIFKVLRSRFCSAFRLLSRALDYLTTFASVCQALFSDFFRGLFRSPVRFRFSAALLRVFRALSRALRYYTAPSLKCQHLFSCFFKFLFSHCILCLFLFYIPGLPCFLETGANLSGRKSPFLGELTLIGGTGFAYI